jgi:hypothetical protein
MPYRSPKAVNMLCRILTLLVVLVLLPLGCLGTPQPDPPNIDPAHIFGFGTLGPPTVRILGEEGAVVPADVLLRIYSLDQTEPPVDVTPAPDGSFDIEVPGLPDEEFRLQALRDGERSLPLDVVVVTTGTGLVQPAPRPLADCLWTSPELETTVPAGGRATIRLRNDCVDPVVVSRIAIRVPVSPFAVVSPTAPADLPAGAELPIVVEYVPLAGDPDEEILLLETSAPLADRRPITLVGTP